MENRGERKVRELWERWVDTVSIAFVQFQWEKWILPMLLEQSHIFFPLLDSFQASTVSVNLIAEYAARFYPLTIRSIRPTPWNPIGK